MKKLIPIFALAFLVGCATFQNNAGKTLASAAATVDAAMKGWAAFVVAGGATDAQQAQVRAAYGKYQLAMSAAETAYLTAVKSGDQSAWGTAASALLASQSQLIALVQSFQTQPKHV